MLVTYRQSIPVQCVFSLATTLYCHHSYAIKIVFISPYKLVKKKNILIIFFIVGICIKTTSIALSGFISYFYGF